MNIDKVMNITKEKELENELDIQSWLVLMEINENRYRESKWISGKDSAQAVVLQECQ